HQLAAIEPALIARVAVIGHVLLVEAGNPAAVPELADQPAPQRGVAVAPRRTDRQPEHHQPHGQKSTPSLSVSSFTPQSPMTKQLTEAGCSSKRVQASTGRPST